MKCLRRDETRKTKKIYMFYKSTFSSFLLNTYIYEKQILTYFILLSIQEWMVPKMSERCSNCCTNTLGGCLVLTEMTIFVINICNIGSIHINVTILLVCICDWVFMRLSVISQSPKNASKKCWKYSITFLLYVHTARCTKDITSCVRTRRRISRDIFRAYVLRAF